MKKKTGFFPFLICAGIFVTAVASISAAGPQNMQQQAVEDELTVKAKAFLAALTGGKFEEAVKDFDETMIKVSGPAKLEEFWKAAPGHIGVFKRQTQARREQAAPYEIVLITCEFDKVTLDARVVFDKNKKIAGFQFVPPAPPLKYKEPAYSDPKLFEEREITVGDLWPLQGTLTLPKGVSPFPALILVHGSGPNDRDETIAANKPFKDLAWGLASKGIAVLRYDKRTKVYGPKLAADPAILRAFTVKEETIDDALIAVGSLRSVNEIDPKRIFILGHSLGGMLIPRIASEPGAENAAGFIIMAGLTRKLEDTFLQQTTYILGLDGSLSDDDRSKLADLKKDADKIKNLTETDAASDAKYLFAPARYWLDLRGYDPAEMSKIIKKPLLVLQGSRDYQVTVSDFENWNKSLAGKTNVEFKLYPKLNHLFIEGQGMSTPQEYASTAANVASYVIDDIASWIRGRSPKGHPSNPERSNF